jgi:hypothetical protein
MASRAPSNSNVIAQMLVAGADAYVESTRSAGSVSPSQIGHL